jgi:prophage tail gpP-like protein
LKKRVDTEARWTKAQQIQVTCVVQGWLFNGSLWEAGKNVNFNSRMAMIKQELAVQSVTFTQDNQQGSLTTLLLVAPWGLNAQRGFLPPTSMQPPTPARADSSPPKAGQ